MPSKAKTKLEAAQRPARAAAKKAAKAPAKRSGGRRATPRGTRKASASPTNAKPKLLSGGNPQIPKGDGDAPVQAYIAAMPGWKRECGRRIDAFIERTVPHVRKAVRWNSPFYGIEGRGWFLGLHCFTHYVQVTFLRGTSLRPVPPGPSKHPHVRYLNIREEDAFDEKLFGTWIEQAVELPGDPLF